MRKKLLLVRLAIVCMSISILSPAVFALHAIDGQIVEVPDGSTASFAVHGSVGILNGEAHEYVYLPEIGHKMSELIWDISSVTMGGLGASINFFNMFRLNVGYWTALTEGNGGMEDYDWFMPDLPDTWTHLSRHDVKIVDAWIFDVNVSTELYKFESDLSLRGQIGIKQDYWEWEDAVKEYIYSSLGNPWGDPPTDYSWNQIDPTAIRDIVIAGDGGRCIDYNQKFTIPYIGVACERAWDRFRLNGYLNLSIGVSAEDNDFHRLREIHFTETFDGGTYIGIGLSALYNITDTVYAMINYDYQSIPEIKGDMEIKETGEKTSDGAGISNEHGMLSASLGMTF